MSSNLHPTDDRETLSALFDDELQGDEARFALRRLGHDAQWRQTCGRWQLYGDLLRGQAQGVAAGGFAERVAVAISQESHVEAVAASARSGGGRRGWIGGALAASVAVAALFVTRPFSSDPAPAPSDAAPQVAATTSPSPSPASVVAPVAQAPAAPTAPTAPDQSLALSAAAVAVAEVPRRAADRRGSRASSSRANRPESIQPAAAAPTAIASVAPAPVDTPAASNANPFQPHTDAVSRPWPRAVLPQYSNGGAMTASFGAGASSPSFYPFEPATVMPAGDGAPNQDAPDQGAPPRR